MASIGMTERTLGESCSCSSASHTTPPAIPRARADIEMTEAIVEIARPLEIAVHDHLIVGKDGHASLKALKLM
jgi:DNA repair protein RadC